MADEARAERVLDGRAGPECLDRVHALLADLWDEVPEVDPARRMGFEIAVAEVTANILEHAAGPGEDPVEVTVSLRAYADRVVACFRDTGREALVDVDSAALPDDEAERGRGLAMARAAVDELTYAREDGRNVWRVVQRRA